MDLHVCCNDPDNGLFLGRATSLHLSGSDDIELEALRDPGPCFVELGDAIRLAGKRWPISSGKDWVGNWCWNAYALAAADTTPRWKLTEFLIWLRGRYLYQMTLGPSDLFDWFNDPTRSLSPAEIHALISEETPHA